MGLTSSVILCLLLVLVLSYLYQLHRLTDGIQGALAGALVGTLMVLIFDKLRSGKIVTGGGETAIETGNDTQASQKRALSNIRKAVKLGYGP